MVVISTTVHRPGIVNSDDGSVESEVEASPTWTSEDVISPFGLAAASDVDGAAESAVERVEFTSLSTRRPWEGKYCH